MEIEGSVALVTGASRGIGLAFARALLARGAARVYAGVRRPEEFDEPGLEPLLLDVTNRQHIEAAAAKASDASTDATKRLDVPKVTAAEVAEKTMDAIIRNDRKVLVDESARRVRSLLSGPLDSMYPTP
jgi:NAD(P)-dependent dehydrogenase (short-subunit alcohol dehydrogenase family)